MMGTNASEAARSTCKVHLAVDTLGQVLAVHVTPANVQDRALVAELTMAFQEASGETVTVAFDQGYTGPSRRQPRPPKASI